MQRVNTGSRSNRGALVVVAAVAVSIAFAACGGSAGPAETTTVTSTDATTGATSTTAPTGPRATELVATACTWRWFDRYDIEFAVPADIPKGTEVDFFASLFQGDVSSVGAAGTLMVDGSDRQVAEARVAMPISWVNQDELEVYRHDALSPPPGALCEVSSDDPLLEDGYIDLAYDVEPPASDGTPFGDLLSVTSADATTFPLAELLFLDPSPPFDRLFLAPELELQTISVRREGTCRLIQSGYLMGNDTVRVQQRHGCVERFGEEELLPGRTSESVGDGNWLVQVVGPEQHTPQVVAALRSIDVPGGEEVDGPPEPAADEWLDGYLADHPEIVELGRFEFHGGKVSIVDRIGIEGSSPAERYLDPLVSAPGVNYASRVVSCDEYTIGIASSVGSYPTSAEPGGYAFFIARDPGTTFTLMAPGLPPKVVPEPTANGVHLAFLDIGESALQTPQVIVSDAEGRPVPCTQ